MTHAENSASYSLTPWRVRGLSRGRKLVSEFNELFLTHLSMLSGTDHPDGLVLLRQAPFGLLLDDKPAIKAIAAAPYLLGDFGFGDTAMWSSWLESKSAPRLLRSHRGNAPTPVASLLARRALTTTWMLCEQEPRQVPLYAGLSVTIARRLGALGLDEVERIASGNMHSLRPRWEETPGRWTAIINAATSRNHDGLQSLLVHGLLLLAGTRLTNAARAHPPLREQPGAAFTSMDVQRTPPKLRARGRMSTVSAQRQDIQSVPSPIREAQAR